VLFWWQACAKYYTNQARLEPFSRKTTHQPVSIPTTLNPAWLLDFLPLIGSVHGCAKTITSPHEWVEKPQQAGADRANRRKTDLHNGAVRYGWAGELWSWSQACMSRRNSGFIEGYK